MKVPPLGAEASIAIRRRGGAGTHADRRTKRLRTRTAVKRAALTDQKG